MPTAKNQWNEAVPLHNQIRATKRRALLREAGQAFSRHGFHATTLDDLARNLGVTKAALYHYYPNKSALLKACFDDVMEDVFANLAQAVANGSNGRDKLKRVFAGYLHRIIKELTVAVVVMEDNVLTPNQRAEVVDARDRFERSLRDLVNEGIADGSIVPCDPKLVVFTMLGAVNWVPRWFRHGGEWSPKELADAMSDILDRAISTQPSKTLAMSAGGAPQSRKATFP